MRLKGTIKEVWLFPRLVITIYIVHAANFIVLSEIGSGPHMVPDIYNCRNAT